MDDDAIPLRAFAHPLRLRLLSLLTGSALSAAEAARELGTSQANTSYHLRQLHAAGLVDLVEEVSVRGGAAKRYRHDPSVGDRLRGTDPQSHLTLAVAQGQELRRRAALRAGGPAHLTDAELWVDETVWADVTERVRAAMIDLHAAAQPPRAPGAVRTSATISLFTMSPDGPSTGGDLP